VSALLVNAGFYTSSESFLHEGYMHDMVTSDSIDIVYRSVTNEQDYFPISSPLSVQNTNVRFVLLDRYENIVAKNTDSLEDCQYTYYFTVDMESGIPDIWMINDDQAESEENVYILRAYVSKSLNATDKYSLASKLISIGYSLRYAIYVIALCCLLISITCFVHLISVAARRPDSENCHPGPLNRIPFDLLLFITAASLILILAFLTDALYTGEFVLVIFFIIWCIVSAMALLGLCMSAAARVKQKAFLKNNLIYMLLCGIRRAVRFIVKSIPMIPKALICVFAISVINILIYALAMASETLSGILLILGTLIFILAAIYVIACLKLLMKGVRALSKGDLSYKVDTSAMIGSIKRHGEDLNRISEGMSSAIDERLKSERTKTELITNVSHDIKNPLTSIINYAQLIGDVGNDEEKRKEYSEVLVRKSTHLKRLLEDLVEISKASSGNLEVDLIECDAGVLLTQMSGEFESRCKNAGIELITKQPEEPLIINIDGKKIWRVFDNLMGNICKYSLVGSRVYLTLEKQDDSAVFIFKNTSKEALNISPDELIERFVRGDTSRTGDGNGLGLSIADSLTELMGGKLSLSIDGDLFKVILKFPTVK
jgi:signal transduction histidine kinase